MIWRQDNFSFGGTGKYYGWAISKVLGGRHLGTHSTKFNLVSTFISALFIVLTITKIDGILKTFSNKSLASGDGSLGLAFHILQ